MSKISIQKLIKNNIFFFKVFFILFASFFFLLLIFQDRPSLNPVLIKVNYSTEENFRNFIDQAKKKISFIDKGANNYFVFNRAIETYNYNEFVHFIKNNQWIDFHLKHIIKKEYAKKKEDQRNFIFRIFFNPDVPVSTFETSTIKRSKAEADLFFKKLIEKNNQYLLEEYVNEWFQEIVKRRERMIGLHSNQITDFIVSVESYFPELKNVDPRSYIPELAEIEPTHTFDGEYPIIDTELLKKTTLEGEKLRIAIKYKKILQSIYNLSTESIYHSAPDYALWLHLLKLNQTNRDLEKDRHGDYESVRVYLDLNPNSEYNSSQLNDFLFFYYVLLEARDQFKENEDLYFSNDTKFHYNINKNKKFNYEVLEKELTDLAKTFSPKYEIYFDQKNYFKHIVGLILFLSLFLATIITIIKNYPKLGKKFFIFK